ncbi:non-specific lipid-transfer protein 2-like [Chenopodium quinoa]|uniref:Bifunctional inhibitor/plant lipid transfer protein/seed storage helical domain-containing protein n=1 Tax=Chenopodium quinoa TaxID=63459 RepID=A0A803MZ59_CHEQI|nr:non-specific lipid-transfer protein 2-like [Chenopodium quinoa]
MKPSFINMAICAVLVLVLANTVEVANAVSCSPAQLSPCVNAITSASPPTAVCCSKIKEQKPCLCQYMKNPYLKKFVNTPNAWKVARSCGTPFPKC